MRLSVGQAFQQGLAEEMERDPRVIVMGTDLFLRGGHFAQVKGLGDRFGRDRIRDAPISEAALVGAGVGAAMNGLVPIVDLNFVDFALGAMDEIVNQAAKMTYMGGGPVPLVIRASYGVAFFASQHNNSLEGFFMSTPGLTTLVPSTPTDTKILLKEAIRAGEPTVFLMHKRLTGVREEVPDDLPHAPIGQAAVRREGSGVTLIGYGVNVRKCMDAAGILSERGVEAEVIDLRSLYPLDVDTLTRSVRKTGRAVVVTETPPFGVGAQVGMAIEMEVYDDLVAPIQVMSAPRSAIPHAPPLIDAMVPDAASIADTVTASLQRWPAR